MSTTIPCPQCAADTTAPCGGCNDTRTIEVREMTLDELRAVTARDCAAFIASRIKATADEIQGKPLDTHVKNMRNVCIAGVELFHILEARAKHFSTSPLVRNVKPPKLKLQRS